MRPLNRQEFSIALKKGLGRARQHVMKYGIGEFYDLVLEACLHDLNYDAQCNDSRAPWLFSMIHNTPYYENIRTAIFDNLDPTDSHDFIQSCIFMREMALLGDDQARQKLLGIVFSQAKQGSSEDSFITDLFLDSLSPDEFLALARIFGYRLIHDPSDHPPDCPIFSDKSQAFLDLLSTNEEQDQAITRYHQYLITEKGDWVQRRSVTVQERKESRRISFRLEYPLKSLLADIHNKSFENRSRYSTFGRYATKKELKIVYNALIAEKDSEVQRLLLKVFHHAPMPELNEIVFQWVNGPDESLRNGAIEALSMLQNDRVHFFAQSLIQETVVFDDFTNTLTLFHHNYESSDAQLITFALTTLQATEYELHSVGMDLLTLSEIQSDPNLADALTWLYEVTTCTSCRYRVLVELKKYNLISPQIAAEIPFDSEESTRELAEQLTSGTT